MTTQQSIRVERLDDVKRRTGKSRAGIYKDMAIGTFPRCIKLSVRAVGWRSDEIDHWIATRTPYRTR